MRILTLFVLILLVAQVNAQRNHIDLTKIKFGNLQFKVTKEEIIKTFGEPQINFPNYDCGGLSDAWQGGTFYQLVYPSFVFIGRDNEKFLLEMVQFDVNGKNVIYYENEKIDGNTTKDKLIDILGMELKPEIKGDSLFIQTLNDDGARFIFHKSLLIRFEYWTPC